MYVRSGRASTGAGSLGKTSARHERLNTDGAHVRTVSGRMHMNMNMTLAAPARHMRIQGSSPSEWTGRDRTQLLIQSQGQARQSRSNDASPSASPRIAAAVQRVFSISMAAPMACFASYSAALISRHLLLRRFMIFLAKEVSSSFLCATSCSLAAATSTFCCASAAA